MTRPGKRAVRLLALLAALVAAGVTSTASAQDSGGTAARAFQAGSQAYARGDFRVAAASFDEAYRIAPRGAAAYNAGLSWEAAGEAARACDEYARALRASDLGTVERADTTGRLKNLERKVGRLTVFVPDDARVWLDDVDVTDTVKNMHVAPGEHALRIELATGKPESRTIHMGAGELVEIRRGQSADAAPTTPQAGPSPPPTSDSHEVPPAGKTDHLPALIAFGGAAVAGALAITFFEIGSPAASQLQSNIQHNVGTQQENDSLHDKAETFRTLTWISWGVAAASAGLGVYLYFTEKPDPSTPATTGTSTRLQLDPTGVSLHVGF